MGTSPDILPPRMACIGAARAPTSTVGAAPHLRAPPHDMMTTRPVALGALLPGPDGGLAASGELVRSSNPTTRCATATSEDGAFGVARAPPGRCERRWRVVGDGESLGLTASTDWNFCGRSMGGSLSASIAFLCAAAVLAGAVIGSVVTRKTVDDAAAAAPGKSKRDPGSALPTGSGAVAAGAEARGEGSLSSKPTMRCATFASDGDWSLLWRPADPPRLLLTHRVVGDGTSLGLSAKAPVASLSEHSDESMLTSDIFPPTEWDPPARREAWMGHSWPVVPGRRHCLL